MISFELENENGNIVDINDGVRYLVTGASGLNPPSASIFTSKSPNRKGAKYNGSTLNERNIVISIKILGDIEANRNALYEWVDTEQYCKVRYRNETKNVYCEGHVQDCPIDIFTDNEIVSVAILCENPYWKDLEDISADISALIKQFTFPFAIDDVGVPFSTMRENYTTTVFHVGSPTGVRIIIRCEHEVKNLAIYDGKDTTRKIALNYTIPAGWTVIIDTENSPKTIKAHLPNGSTINLLPYVEYNPTWFELKKGANVFTCTADEDTISNAEISVNYTNKYLGI